MAITFGKNAIKPTAPSARHHGRKAVVPLIPLDQPGRLRLANLQALFGCSHATIYSRMEQGLLPQPDGYDLANRPKGRRGRPYWYTATIRPLLVPPQ